MEPSSPDQEPPAKKRRVDESEDPIVAKLTQIRSNMDQANPSSTTEQSNANTPSKKNKKKNKNKNKTPPQQNVSVKKEPNFDYSSVDFKKFAGGSIVEQKNDIKMKFHGKVCFQLNNLSFLK